MFGHRNDHQQRKRAIQGRNGPEGFRKHRDVDRPKGDARDYIRDEGNLFDQLAQSRAPALHNGIAQDDAQHGREEGRKQRKLNRVPRRGIDPWIEQDPDLAMIDVRIALPDPVSGRQVAQAVVAVSQSLKYSR